MAKESIKMDQFFREKLSTHEEKPSSLAWERLENQLHKKPKSTRRIWWAAAASIILILSVGYLVMQAGNPAQTPTLISANTPDEVVGSSTASTPSPKEVPIPETTGQHDNQTDENPVKKNLKAKPTPQKTNSKPAKPSPKIEAAPSSGKLIAMTELDKKEGKNVLPELAPIVVDEIEIKEPKLTEQDLPQSLAADIKEKKVEEPAYKVTIYSNGIKEPDKDKNLIADIGKKVEQVEDLIGKVDQGFADLQDAKENLFVSLLTKKEK